jgi:hypothetical protein
MNQLKELRDKKQFDFFEIFNNEIVFYFLELSPKEEKKISLYLDAVVPGNYIAPACSAYLYYTNENKSWENGISLNITN